MINLLQGLSVMGFLVGAAGIAGAIELDQSPARAFIIAIVSMISLFILEKIEIKIKRVKKYERKNNSRIY